jgi:hypothetical protein
MVSFLHHWRNYLSKKSSKYYGRWTNDGTDLVLDVINIRHIYENCVVKVKYKLYNKNNGIHYETKTAKLAPEFFKLNQRIYG